MPSLANRVSRKPTHNFRFHSKEVASKFYAHAKTNPNNIIVQHPIKAGTHMERDTSTVMVTLTDSFNVNQGILASLNDWIAHEPQKRTMSFAKSAIESVHIAFRAIEDGELSKADSEAKKASAAVREAFEYASEDSVPQNCEAVHKAEEANKMVCDLVQRVELARNKANGIS